MALERDTGLLLRDVDAAGPAGDRTDRRDRLPVGRARGEGDVDAGKAGVDRDDIARSHYPKPAPREVHAGDEAARRSARDRHERRRHHQVGVGNEFARLTVDDPEEDVAHQAGVDYGAADRDRVVERGEPLPPLPRPKPAEPPDATL